MPRHQGGNHICAGLGSPGIPAPGSFLHGLGGGQEGGPCHGPSETPRTLSGLVWLWDHDSCPLAPPPACRPPPPGQTASPGAGEGSLGKTLCLAGPHAHPTQGDTVPSKCSRGRNGAGWNHPAPEKQPWGAGQWGHQRSVGAPTSCCASPCV